MKLYAIQCPHCGGQLEAEEGLESFYCKYCGSKIEVDNHFTLRKVDEARIREAETREKIRLKELEIARKKQKFKHIMIVISIIMVIIAFVAGVLMSQSEQYHSIGSTMLFLMILGGFFIPIFYLIKHTE